MSDSDSGISFVAGLVFGTLIGGVLGVLLAPQSGAETRQQLQDETIELGDRARQRAEDVSARGRMVLEEHVAQMGEAVTEGKKAASETRQDLRAKLQQARFGEPQLPQA